MEIVIKGLTPLSYNSKNKTARAAYQKRILSAFQRRYNGAVPRYPANQELYAKVYFFTSDGVNVDADNISKPIWDAVNGLVYKNGGTGSLFESVALQSCFILSVS